MFASYLCQCTVATDELLCDKHAVWGMGLNGFIFKKLNKKKNPGGCLGYLPVK